jgi:hypothetical protein
LKDYGSGTYDKQELLKDMDLYARTLALAMSKEGSTQVNYLKSGTFYKTQNKYDQWFKFEDSSVLKDIYKSLPLRDNCGVYSFKHKSFQEFFVAQTIYEKLMG